MKSSLRQNIQQFAAKTLNNNNILNNDVDENPTKWPSYNPSTSPFP